MDSLWKFLRRARPEPKSEAVEQTPPTPVFVCRTCRTSGHFYVAREVVNWNKLGDIYRNPAGGLTYRSYNVYLPGEPGPPLRYVCTNCNTYAEDLDGLVEGEAEALLREVEHV